MDKLIEAFEYASRIHGNPYGTYSLGLTSLKEAEAFAKTFLDELRVELKLPETLDEYKDELAEGLYTNHSFDSFARSNVFTRLINMLKAKGLILNEQDEINNFKNMEMFCPMFQRIEDMDFKRKYLEEHPMIAEYYLFFCKKEDGLFAECLVLCAKEGRLDTALRNANSVRGAQISLSEEQLKIIMNSYVEQMKEDVANQGKDLDYSEVSAGWLLLAIDSESKYKFLKLALNNMFLEEESWERKNKAFIRDIWKYFSDEEKEQFRETEKGTDEEIILKYNLGEIELELMASSIKAFYFGEIDKQALREQLVIYGINIDLTEEDPDKLLETLIIESCKKGCIPVHQPSIDLREPMVDEIRRIGRDKIEYFKKAVEIARNAGYKGLLGSLTDEKYWLLKLEDSPKESVVELINHHFGLFKETIFSEAEIKLWLESIINQGPLDFSIEELDALFSGLINRNFFEGLIDIVSYESLERYINTKTIENEKDKLIWSQLIGFLELETFSELSIDDYRRTELLIRTNNVELEDFVKCLESVKDEYLKTLALSSQFSEGLSKEKALSYMKEYRRLYQYFEKLTSDEEKRDFLIELLQFLDKSLFETSIDEYSDEFVNVCMQVKKLLKEIDSHEYRMEVIQNIPCDVDDNLQDIINLAQEMIREYVYSEYGESPELQELLEFEFKSLNAIVGDSFDEETIVASIHFIDRKIQVRGSRIMMSPIDALFDVLHEYGHAFSMRDFLSQKSHSGKDFEEGIADTFSELVFNAYLERHGTITIDDIVCEYNGKYLESDSSYVEPNAKFKSILYALEATRDDKRFLFEVLFGDKVKMLDYFYGEGSRDLSQIRDINIGYEVLAKVFGERIEKREQQLGHQNSPYLHRNSQIHRILHIYHGEAVETEDSSDGMDTRKEESALRAPITLEAIDGQLDGGK